MMRAVKTKVINDKLVFFVKQEPALLIPKLVRKYISLLEETSPYTGRTYFRLRIWGQDNTESEIRLWPSIFLHRWAAMKYAFYYADLQSPPLAEKTYVSFLQERRFFVGQTFADICKKIIRYPISTSPIFINSNGDISECPHEELPSIIWKFTETDIDFYTVDNICDITIPERLYKLCESLIV